jgi:hypothetical protein
MQISPIFCYFLSLGFIYSPHHFVLKYIQSLFSLMAKDQVLNPYKTTGGIIISIHVQ